VLQTVAQLCVISFCFVVNAYAWDYVKGKVMRWRSLAAAMALLSGCAFAAKEKGGDKR
jgi:TRAP-type C4-dicarboxylate transport system permease small subunit